MSPRSTPLGHISNIAFVVLYTLIRGLKSVLRPFGRLHSTPNYPPQVHPPPSGGGARPRRRVPDSTGQWRGAKRRRPIGPMDAASLRRRCGGGRVCEPAGASGAADTGASRLASL
eukprot:1183404-Prorocentrum_minimum.AAC.1